VEPRLIAAYLLMLLIAIFAATVIGYLYYHAHTRSYARHLRREAREDARRVAERKQASPD
jgi:sensor histidine kinase regulating citrate/malate metabolism